MIFFSFILFLHINVFTHLSKLMAHKLKMEAVHNKTSKDIQISHKIQPKRHTPAKKNKKTKNIRNSCHHFLGLLLLKDFTK